LTYNNPALDYFLDGIKVIQNGEILLQLVSSLLQVHDDDTKPSHQVPSDNTDTS